MKTRLWQPCRNKIVVVGVPGLARAIAVNTSMSVPIDITDDTLASSLVPVQCASLAPPAALKNLGLEVLRLFRRYAHTLAQNSLCEFWCGMHLTCKNTPIIPDRNGSGNRPEKVRKVSLAMASARCKSQITPTWHWLEIHRFEFGLKAVWKRPWTNDMKWNETAWWFLG